MARSTVVVNMNIKGSCRSLVDSANRKATIQTPGQTSKQNFEKNIFTATASRQISSKKNSESK